MFILWKPFLEEISADWRDSVDSIIDTARTLCSARRQLGGGRKKVFQKLVTALASKGISKPTAQRLVSIGSHIGLTNPANRKYLPSSWVHLHALSRVSRAEFDQALKDGKIHPGMTRRDIEALLGRNTPSHKPVKADVGKKLALIRVAHAYDDIEALVRLFAKIKGVIEDYNEDVQTEALILEDFNLPDEQMVKDACKLEREISKQDRQVKNLIIKVITRARQEAVAALPERIRNNFLFRHKHCELAAEEYVNLHVRDDLEKFEDALRIADLGFTLEEIQGDPSIAEQWLKKHSDPIIKKFSYY